MTSLVSLNTDVVNPLRVDGASLLAAVAQSPEHPLVSALDWILKNRNDPETGKRWTMTNLSLAAGLSKSVVANLLRGDMRPEGVSGENIQRFAAAAGVSPEWLLFGSNAPADYRAPVVERTVHLDDLYPSRPAALKLMKGAGVPEDVIEAIATARLESPDDIGVEGWLDKAADFERMMKRLAARRSGDEAGARAPVVDDAALKKLTEKKRGKR